MAKKMSYADLQQRCERLEKEHHAATMALHHLHNQKKPDAEERVREDKDSQYIFRLYGSTRADGGIVVRIFRHRGQSDFVTAMRLDDLYLEWQASCSLSETQLELKSAVQRLWYKRNQLMRESHGLEVR